jgi:hypothetical protein
MTARVKLRPAPPDLRTPHRPAREETCTCGLPANVIYLTGFGDIPHCGYHLSELRAARDRHPAGRPS